MIASKKLKIVVFTGYECNNNCVFCMNADKRGLERRSTLQLLQEIYKAAKKKADTLELIGGEVTIRPDFTKLVRAAHRLGIPRVVCATNGRALADAKFARAVTRSGLDALMFSIHGHSPEVHDALTASPGSLTELLRGISNLKKAGFRGIFGNTTVVKGNMRALPDIAKLYIKLGIKQVEYIFVDPNYGGAKNAFEDVVPRISLAAPYMRKALAAGRRAGFSDWKARYVPLCHFRGFEEQVSELQERETFRTEHWAQDFRNTDVAGSRASVGRSKPQVCRGCLKAGLCEGIWREYLKRFGPGELKPFK